MVLIAIVIVILAGVFLYFRSSPKQETKSSPPPAVSQKSESTPSALPDQQAGKTIPGYQGKKIAGNIAPFLEFHQADYNKALKEDKVIVLNFYANWCPICRAEEPTIHEGFNSLSSDKVIGFRVNYNDSDTDADEKALAKQFKITYQHTKVILKKGQEFSRFLDSWDKTTFDKEIGKAIE